MNQVNILAIVVATKSRFLHDVDIMIFRIWIYRTRLQLLMKMALL